MAKEQEELKPVIEKAFYTFATITLIFTDGLVIHLFWYIWTNPWVWWNINRHNPFMIFLILFLAILIIGLSIFAILTAKKTIKVWSQ